MKILSLKLKDDIFDEVEQVVKKIHVSRNAYINQALRFYNKLNKRKSLKEKLQKESLAVQDVSLDVLKEMELIEDNPVE